MSRRLATTLPSIPLRFSFVSRGDLGGLELPFKIEPILPGKLLTASLSTCLSYFWILPPLMGILVQPVVGVMSDKTWTRFGRRIPYLFVGALVAVLVMVLLPNAGSFGLTVGSAMLFGAIS